MWGTIKNQLPGYPRSGSKAISVEREKERKRDTERERRVKVSVNNGQYIRHTPGPIKACMLLIVYETLSSPFHMNIKILFQISRISNLFQKNPWQCCPTLGRVRWCLVLVTSTLHSIGGVGTGMRRWALSTLGKPSMQNKRSKLESFQLTVSGLPLSQILPPSPSWNDSNFDQGFCIDGFA